MYGEEERAFSRLKREIDERSKSKLEEPTNDQSLFTGENLSYHPLADFGFHLFTLEARVTGTNIVGRIQEISLQSPLAYYALSYVWGREPLIHRVVINEETKFIHPNLFHALQRIRPPTGQYHIWVNSLCIN
jgi:Heterokaryon incompatibility protein (HET)